MATMTKSEREQRANTGPVEVRAEEGGVRVSGYAAVFNEPANIAGVFIEVIAPGAFRSSLGRDDVVFLVEHEGLPMARTRSGTLTLTEDERGLRIDTVLDPDDPDVKAIVGKMKRGDLDKMSFAFNVAREGQDWDMSTTPPTRTIREFQRVHDVSIVTFPAYDGTDIALRSRDEARKEKRQHNFSGASRRIHLDLAARGIRVESKA